MAHYLPNLKKEVFDSVFFIDLIKEYCINIDPNFSRIVRVEHRTPGVANTFNPVVYLDDYVFMLNSSSSLCVNPFIVDGLYRTDEFLEMFKNIESDIISLNRNFKILNLLNE